MTKLANLIDHTALKPGVTKEEILKLTAEAKEYGFYSVCVNPTWVAEAAKQLKGSDVDVCTVIGFPLGANTTAVKVYETTDAINNGATEVDMVINIGALKTKEDDQVLKDIQKVVEAANGEASVKVII